MEEIKYLGLNLCKPGSMNNERRERAVQRRKVIGSLECIMKERTVNMETKRGLCGGIIVLTISYEGVCGMKV